jgi:NAD(P)H-hydrate epimerase
MANRFTYDENALEKLPKRPQRSNKGTFGQVLVVGGSVGMSGAAYFSAKAAYRSGCGLVRILSPEQNRMIYQTQLPEAVLTLYNNDAPDETTVKNAVCRATAIVLGVGLGTSETSKKLLKWTLEAANAPIVLDADGLNIISADKSLFKLAPEHTVITPHPLEMSRLSGLDITEITDDIAGTAERFAMSHNVVCVMKDANTAVSDGHRTMLNVSGNSGMATGGSGDVLSGVIASLLAQGMHAFEAASLGVYIHGLAGDNAALRLSEHSVIASDIIDSLPSVFSKAERE